MEKSKYGIPIGVLGAAAFFLAFTGNIIPLFILALFVFLKEDNEWLKKSIFYAIAIYLATACAITAVSCINDFIGLPGLLASKSWGLPFHLDSFINRIIYLIRYVTLFFFGIKAFKMDGMKIEILDKLYSGVSAAASSFTQQQQQAAYQQPVQPQQTYAQPTQQQYQQPVQPQQTYSQPAQQQYQQPVQPQQTYSQPEQQPENNNTTGTNV